MDTANADGTAYNLGISIDIADTDTNKIADLGTIINIIGVSIDRGVVTVFTPIHSLPLSFSFPQPDSFIF